jgi:outer membrane immunogenic protein
MKFAPFGRIAVTALLIAAPLGGAFAADMPVKAPAPPPPPAFNWNGFYVGAYAGAAWMDPATTTDPCLSTFAAFCLATGVGTFNGVNATTYDMKASFLGGGTVGYNWQPTPYTLLGLENDFGYLHLTGSAVQAAFNDTTAHTKIGDWYDAVTARIGAVDGHAMFYLKGGAAWARYTTGVVDNTGVTINTTTDKTMSGWAAGGGVEYGINMNWSVKAEYLVLGLQKNITGCGPVAVPGIPTVTDCSTTHTPAIQTISLGLNYRFH